MSEGAMVIRALIALALAGLAVAQERVSFATQDGGLVHGLLYGKGDRGVVLAHGGRFNKESWEKQARVLEKAGFHVLAFDFRGYGASTHLDVLAAVRYLRKSGAKTVSIVGGSFGGGAATVASAEAEAGEIDRLIVLGYGSDAPPEKIKGRKMFILCRNDLGSGDIPRLPKARADYEKAREPKELVILECSAHAQFIFATDQGERLMSEILRFLTAP